MNQSLSSTRVTLLGLGLMGTGMASGDAPLRWSDTDSIVWKVPVPGRGHSTPVIAGDRLFLTTAVPTGRASASAGRGRGGGGNADAGLEHRFEVLAIDRASGRTVWQRTATTATPHEGYHRSYGSFASNSPVTDGKRIYAFFGSRGLFVYSLDGDLLWQNLRHRLQHLLLNCTLPFAELSEPRAVATPVAGYSPQ
jgi:outer membrane protein assembly factor BamB